MIGVNLNFKNNILFSDMTNLLFHLIKDQPFFLVARTVRERTLPLTHSLPDFLRI